MGKERKAMAIICKAGREISRISILILNKNNGKKTLIR
jgi:hypothetical protein